MAWPLDVLLLVPIAIAIAAISFFLAMRRKDKVTIVRIKKEDVELTEYVHDFLKAHSGKARMSKEGKPFITRHHAEARCTKPNPAHHPCHVKAPSHNKEPEAKGVPAHKRIHMPHFLKHKPQKATPGAKKTHPVQPKPKPEKAQPASKPKPQAEPLKAKPASSPKIQHKPHPHEPEAKDTDRVNRLLSLMAKAPDSNPRRRMVHSVAKHEARPAAGVAESKPEANPVSQTSEALIGSIKQDLDLFVNALGKLKEKKVDVSQLEREALLLKRTLNLSKKLPEKSLEDTRKKLDNLMWKLSKDYL